MATTLGASNLSGHDRSEHDYYATPPKAGVDLMMIAPYINNIWEVSCGQGHLADGLKDVKKTTDLIVRKNFKTGEENEQLDFLTCNDKWDGWIVTNPPYKYGKEFVEKAIELSGNVAMFLRVQFLESQKRQELFKKYPPKYVYVYSKRCPQCGFNGKFGNTGNATTYCWFIWEKGSKTEPVIRWI